MRKNMNDEGQSYPNGLPGGIPSESFSCEDAERALAMAEKVIALVEKKFP
jgi:HEPN domain-containing protein